MNLWMAERTPDYRNKALTLSFLARSEIMFISFRQSETYIYYPEMYRPYPHLFIRYVISDEMIKHKAAVTGIPTTGLINNQDIPIFDRSVMTKTCDKYIP